MLSSICDGRCFPRRHHQFDCHKRAEAIARLRYHSRGVQQCWPGGEIVNYAGATSIALTRTSNKGKQLLEAGAAQVIATEEVNFTQEVMRLTDGNGARVAFRRIGCETSDAGSAALATSSGASAGMLGRRDGRVTRDEALAQARVICGATDLSVSRMERARRQETGDLRS